jgi:hypothetical protein
MNLLFKYIIFCVLLASARQAQSQTISITGQLADSTTSKKTTNSTILLMASNDSTLVAHTRAQSNGKFTLTINDTGTFVLLITNPLFADYTDIVSITKPTVELGIIYMTTREIALQTFVFKAYKGAVRMKGDTIEYLADSFKVKQNGSVEDLLKKLPGLQVNKDGSVSAQGKKVDIILVDGEEFFSEDPTIVTRNLNATSVDKVQVYEKKSEQAEITGVDDGERQRILNLKLKEGSKRGYFGNVQGSYGPPKWFDNQAMINFFKGRRKVSAYIIHNNVGKGLSWSDTKNFGTTDERSGPVAGDDGSMYYFSSNADQDIDIGKGLPTTLNGGLHYSNTFKPDTHHLVVNYSFSNPGTRGKAQTTTQQLLNGRTYINKQTSTLNNYAYKHSSNALYEWKPDSFNYLKLYTAYTHSENVKNTTFESSYKDQFDSALNSSSRINSSNDKKDNISEKLEYRHKFKKKGRQFSLVAENSNNTSSGSGELLSINKFYRENNVYKVDTINQIRETVTKSSNNSATANFSEPILKKLTWNISYTFTQKGNHNTTNSFNKVGSVKQDLNTLYSNEYLFNTSTHTPGTSFSYNEKKWTLRGGGSVIFNNFYQKNVVLDTVIKYNFTNFQRNANFTYKFHSQKNLNLNYNGNVAAPNINQIQPIRNNTDPFNIYIGNPNLKPSVTNNFSCWYSNYKILKKTHFYLSMFSTFHKNAFATLDSVDGYGKRISQTVNINGNYNTSWWMQYNFNIKKTKFHVNTSTEMQQGRNNNFINGVANTTNYINPSAELTLSYEIEDTFSIDLSIDEGYNYAHSSISNAGNTSYWIHTYSADAYLNLPWHITIETDVNFTIRQKTSVFTNNNNMILWNAAIERRMFKDEKSILSISVHDILNQNIGFSRNINSNYITEKSYQTLQRYFLLSFKYVFNKQGGEKK